MFKHNGATFTGNNMFNYGKDRNACFKKYPIPSDKDKLNICLQEAFDKNKDK